MFRVLGRSGLLALPYPERFGGGGQPYETYLQVVEELAAAWLAVGLGVSVHTLTCFPLVTAGTPEQRSAGCPDMLGGDQLGAYCLSEPASGSDAAALRTTAEADGADYVIDGVKAWISHAGQADFYTLFARTSGDHEGPGRARGISCLHVPAQTPGVSAAPRRAQDGHARLGHRADDLRWRPGARRPPGRRGGQGVRHRAGRAGRRTPRHRGLRHRRGPGGAGRRGELGAGAAPVRPADRGLPGRVVPARGHGHGRRGGPGPVPVRRPAQGRRACRTARRPRWPSCSPATPRCG